MLECQDHMTEGGYQGCPQPEDAATETPPAQEILCADLLESIEKTMTQITLQLAESAPQDEDDNVHYN